MPFHFHENRKAIHYWLAVIKRHNFVHIYSIMNIHVDNYQNQRDGSTGFHSLTQPTVPLNRFFRRAGVLDTYSNPDPYGLTKNLIPGLKHVLHLVCLLFPS
jgi:hypothetical protein